MAYTDGFWWSNDGLRLHYRDYAGGDAARPPILCIPGLTRNARDFEGLAERLAGAWRVIAIDLRGRGESAYAKDPLTYAPVSYKQDLEALLAELGIERFVLAGTSMGGLLAMHLGAADPARVAGLIVNDVGPELDEIGMARIRSTIGRTSTWPTWVHAARDFAELHKQAFPKWTLEDWLAFAKRMAKIGSAGRIVPDYDMRIAEALRVASPVAGMDLWSAWQALSAVPALVVRGERSDILSAETLARMTASSKRTETVTVRGIGHAPTLDEPEVVAAIDGLLTRVAERLAIA
jgi:pimeloyl-ACP methyl ester carboxylesterase